MGEVHSNGDSDHCNGCSKMNGGAVMKNGGASDGVLHGSKRSLWFEEEIEEDLRWVFSVSKILHTGVSEFQDIALLESGPFGKVLILDGKLQSAEADEFVYHEALVHPALIYHPNPKSVFMKRAVLAGSSLVLLWMFMMGLGLSSGAEAAGACPRPDAIVTAKANFTYANGIATCDYICSLSRTCVCQFATQGDTGLSVTVRDFISFSTLCRTFPLKQNCLQAY